jgi:hypothetical protein
MIFSSLSDFHINRFQTIWSSLFVFSRAEMQIGFSFPFSHVPQQAGSRRSAFGCARRFQKREERGWNLTFRFETQVCGNRSCVGTRTLVSSTVSAITARATFSEVSLQSTTPWMGFKDTFSFDCPKQRHSSDHRGIPPFLRRFHVTERRAQIQH